MIFWKRKNWDEEFDENYADRIRERPIWQPRAIWPHLLVILICGILFVSAAGIVGGQFAFEKTLLAMAQPVGLIWLGLMILIYFALLFRQTFPAIIGIVLWAILMTAGNGFIANSLAQHLESEWIEFQLKDVPKLDVAIVLGGGTNTRISGEAQLGGAGDRIATAAQLYHQQNEVVLICTGSQPVRTGKDQHPRDEAFQLLQGLGVPKTQLQRIKGATTFEESQSMRKYLDENPDIQRIGLITSAWHIPRARALMNREKIEVIAIPSNFFSGPFTPTPESIIPSADSLRITQLMLKELLARSLGR